MSTPSDKSPEEFAALEKLLRLKRHEQPHPRYFTDFSGGVLNRIERGEGRPSWWERFGFDLRPALAAGAGLVACGLIVYAVATADGGPASATPALSFDNSTPQRGALTPESEKSVGANSTNPVLSAYGDLGTPVDRKVFRGETMQVQFRGQ